MMKNTWHASNLVNKSASVVIASLLGVHIRRPIVAKDAGRVIAESMG